MNYPTQFRTAARSLLVLFALGFFAVCESLRAVVPPPDGSYPGFNTAEGQSALFNLTTGVGNTAVGWFSLWSDVDGSYNTAVGAGTLLFNTGNQSTSEGTQNTAVGTAALLNNTTGLGNTAGGVLALSSNTEGILNTADGFRGMFMNTTGNRNTANGVGALSSNTEGNDNTAIGVNALLFNITGDNNTALGRSAGLDIHGNGNVCIGQGVSGEAGVDDSTYIRNVNTTQQSPGEGIAFVTVRLSDSRIGHQPLVMGSASSELEKTLEELKSTVARQEATIAQLKEAMEVITARLNE